MADPRHGSGGRAPARDADADGDDVEDLAAEAEEAAAGSEAEAATPEAEAPGEAPETETPEVEVVERGPAGLVRYDPLQAYINDIRRYALLAPEEELALARRFRDTGDLEAARRLVTANLRLVVKIAYEYKRAYANLLDLVQEGNVGLMMGVHRFDPERGVRLTTYAAWWIRAYILKFILANWRLVKIGTTQAQRKLFYNLKKERRRLEELGIRPGPKLLAERLAVSEKDVEVMEQRMGAPDVSLDQPVGREDGGRPRVEVSPSAEPGADRVVEQEEFQRLLRAKLAAFGATLEGRERTIFRERLLADEPRTLAEIGERYGFTRERARQIEKRLLDRLREYLRAELGEAVEIAAGEG